MGAMMDDRTPEVNDELEEARAAEWKRLNTPRPPRTHEEKVQLKLTVIAWSTGILAAITVLNVIVGFISTVTTTP